MSTDPDLRHTADLLVPLLYSDLRRIARSARWQVSATPTIQTTALVHEAYLRLRRTEGFNDQQHFLRAASIAMRQILVNVARDVLAQKRGGGGVRLSLDDDTPDMAEQSAETLVEVSEALDRLGELSPRLAEIVECRFFGGFSDEETARALGVSDRTVRREWLKARAWLRHELGDAAPDGRTA